jgi:hypothetical protein
MPEKTQPKKHDALPLRRAMFEKGMSVSKLARRIKRPRPTVSKAIHHGKFPLVLKRIKEVLRAA